MANTIMTTVYNHYMTAYSPKKSDARLDSHDKTELKNIYSNILKLNKEAPLYIFDKKSDQVTDFALSLKENTRQLQYTILSTAGKRENDLFKNKTAYSSNEDVASVTYIGAAGNDTDSLRAYELEVHALASPQINSGYFLADSECSLEPGNYSFDVETNNLAYEFQFSVDENETNYDIQSKLARLFNHANLGLNASLVEGPENTAALRITSLQTGQSSNSADPLFTIRNSHGGNGVDVVDYFGIDYISTPACDASFTINGEPKTSSSNHFTIDKAFEVTLHNVSPQSGEPVMIGLKANVDSLKDNVYHLIGGYNSFLKAADEYRYITSSNRLSYEVENVARSYRNELDAVGINITDNGTLSVDERLLTETAQSEEAYDLLSPLKEFSTSLYEKGEEISRDPLNYASKKIVAYKNPGKNFTSPYVSSSYSGLLFNYYC